MKVEYHLEHDVVESSSCLKNDTNKEIHRITSDPCPLSSHSFGEETQYNKANAENICSSSPEVAIKTIQYPHTGTDHYKLTGSYFSRGTLFRKVITKHQCLAGILLIQIIFITLLTVIWITSAGTPPDQGPVIYGIPPNNTNPTPVNPGGIPFTSNTAAPQGGNVPTFYNGKKTSLLPQEVVLNSLHSLRSVSEVTHTVIVERLTSPAIPSPAGLSSDCCSSVKHLSLQGPVSQEWVYYLLNSFRNLETLTVDVDLVVSEWKHVDELDKIILIHLHSIYVTNSQENPVFQWGFGLELPNLRIMSISKSTLTLKAFKNLQSFLGGSRTIEGIEITESYICPECDVTELQFPKMKYMRITRVKSKISN